MCTIITICIHRQSDRSSLSLLVFSLCLLHHRSNHCCDFFMKTLHNDFSCRLLNLATTDNPSQRKLSNNATESMHWFEKHGQVLRGGVFHVLMKSTLPCWKRAATALCNTRSYQIHMILFIKSVFHFLTTYSLNEAFRKEKMFKNLKISFGIGR